MAADKTIFEYAPYAVPREEKQPRLLHRLNLLTAHHAGHCRPYARMLRAMGGVTRAARLEEVPFIPVSLFKALTLRSVPQDAVFKTVASSGTGGQAVSRIYLDKATAGLQRRVLAAIVGDFLPGRCPMLIIDSPAVLRDRAGFSARGAGIVGFSLFGARPVYALDEAMRPDMPAIAAFCEKNAGGPVFLFGFTFIVWRHFICALREAGVKLLLRDAVLIHGGGWKKLAGQAVTPGAFSAAVREICGTVRVHDYYGMAEQTGSIHMACGQGHLHAPACADVLVRRPSDWSVCGVGEAGVLQVLSAVPESYPGHSLLTEDEGVLLGEDDCPCGRKGKYFRVLGRLPNAELRGCSDAYAEAAGLR